MDIEAFRKAGYAAVDDICDYYQKLQNDSVPVQAQVEPGFLAKVVPSQAPEEGEAWDIIARDYREQVLPGVSNWQHPNFHAYFPCAATLEGGLADLHAAVLSNPGFNWTCSPSSTELEVIVLDWMAKMLGLSQDFHSDSPSGKGGGIILGTASEVAVTVAIAARERALVIMAEKEPPPSSAPSTATPPQNDHPQANGKAHSDAVAALEAEGHQAASLEAATIKAASVLAKWRGGLTSRLVMYGTTQTHSIGAKAALILGLDFRALEVTAEDGFALRGKTLERALQEDEAMGRVPFMLIATLGTTSSGAIDNLPEIVQVARTRPTLYLHVDAAWAGVALSLPEARDVLYPEALKQVDSFSTNYHKWGLVQLDCSPLWVRDRTALSNALTITPEFLRTRQGDANPVLDFRNLQMPLGRRFRSLKVWFVLRSYGLKGFRNYLRSGISMADHFEKLLSQDDRFELVAPPSFSLRVFRLRGTSQANGDGHEKTQDVDALNRAFWEALQKRTDEIWLTQTILPQTGFCVRLVVGSPFTKEEHIDKAWKVIKECAEEALQ